MYNKMPAPLNRLSNARPNTSSLRYAPNKLSGAYMQQGAPFGLQFQNPMGPMGSPFKNPGLYNRITPGFIPPFDQTPR